MAHAPGSIRARLQDVTDHAWRLYCALELLIPHQETSPNSQVRISRQKLVSSTIPWHDNAAGLVTELHAEVRRLEVHLREENFGTYGSRRGGSTENTRYALNSIAILADGVNDQLALAVLVVIERWTHRATTVLTPENGLHRLPQEPGAATLRCPHCTYTTMRWHPATGVVVCINPECVTEHGVRPRWQAEFAIRGENVQMIWEPIGVAA